MKVHSLKQGSPEWHQHRATTFNASDAPAMMGCSKYKTRDALLKEMLTGETPEVDAFTQKRFNDGHRFEALARSLAESRIGDELYPVVGSIEIPGFARAFGASFDGITMGEEIGFEHKTINDEIRAAGNVAALPLMYRVQMEQQLMVCQNLERIMFLASRWDADGNCIESKEFWYEQDPALRLQILEGWKMFGDDLERARAGNAPPTKKGVADAIGSLPALSITLRGEVSTSNLPAFQAAAKAFLDGINMDLKTDDDFATAEAQVRYCETSEGKIESALEAALAQASSIDELRRAVLYVKEEIRAKRLKLSKLVETRKVEIKREIQQEGSDRLAEKLKELAPMFGEILPVVDAPDFAGAMRNKRNVSSLRDSVTNEVARCAAIATQIAGEIQFKLNKFASVAEQYRSLFPDLQTIIYKETDDFLRLVEERIRAHEEQIAAKARAIAEAKAKAEAEFIPAAPVSPGPFAKALEKTIQNAVDAGSIMPAGTRIIEHESSRPSRIDLINLVAERYKVSISVARDWLQAEFGG